MTNSGWTNLCRCRSAWKQVCSVLLHSSFQTQRQANHCWVPAPVYRPGLKVWLSEKDLPLKVTSRKLASYYVGPFEVDRIMNIAAVHLKLPATLKVHPRNFVRRLIVLHPFKLSMGEWRSWSITFWTCVGQGGGWHLLVDREGYGPEERLWVQHILDQEVLCVFYRVHLDKPGWARGRDT